MAGPFNFKIKSSLACSTCCKTNALYDFLSLSYFVKSLPYGRPKNSADFTAVLIENKGTCSTKHAFLKQVAIENKEEDIQLFIGLYKMNNANTKGVGSVLKNYNLDYIPEAHTYLKINGVISDFTSTTISSEPFENTLLQETEIQPNQVGDFKVTYHQNYLKQWIKDKHLNHNFDTLWRIRELCIQELSL